MHFFKYISLFFFSCLTLSFNNISAKGTYLYEVKLHGKSVTSKESLSDNSIINHDFHSYFRLYKNGEIDTLFNQSFDFGKPYTGKAASSVDGPGGGDFGGGGGEGGGDSGGVLLSLLVLPLFIPVLVFGAGAVEAQASGLGAQAHFSILMAMLLPAAFFSPFACAAALRIALE